VNRWSVKALCAVLPALVLLAGCRDDPFEIPWEENPFETTIYALDRPELNRPSGFDMSRRARVIIEGPEAGGRWDFAVDRQDGGMVLLPPRVLGVTSRAAIAPIPGVSYDDVREAPRDTLAYISREPVPLQHGTIYVIRTHQQADAFGRQCVFYGRVEPVEMDVETGTFRFRSDTSPECNNRRLVPRGG
jgi:hypothetical protein